MSTQSPQGPPEDSERPTGPERPTEPQWPTQGPQWGTQPPQSSQPPGGWGPPSGQQSGQGWQQPSPPGQGWSTYGQPPQPRPRKRRRVFMWVILGINALFLIAVIATLNISSGCQGMTGDELSACQAGEGIGKGAVFLFLLFVWALVDIVLGVIFMVTRGRAGTAYER
jgi:hypothetical protein